MDSRIRAKDNDIFVMYRDNTLTVFGDVTTGTISLSSSGKSVSNFAVNGPYVNLSVQFA